MVSFNLVNEAWIPAEVEGHRRPVSLREALVRAHDIEALSLQYPTQLPAVLRQVLLPIVIDVFGLPRDDAEWGARWRAGRLGTMRLDAYLDEHRERFDLFHPETPFAQVGGLRTAKDETKPSSLLIPAIATGNNVPLFSARTEANPPALTPAEAALWLLHAHCWDTAAIKSGAQGDPQVKSGKTTGNPTGPLGQLGVVVPIGRTLHETLLLNLPIQPDGIEPGDRPQWRGPVAVPAWAVRGPLGILDLLTWQSRRIRLVPQEAQEGVHVLQVIVAAGDRLLRMPESEPHTAWNVVPKPKAGDPPHRPRRLTSGKAAWQGLEALLAVQRAEDGKVRTTRLLEQAGSLRNDELPADHPLNVLTVGIEYGNQSAVVENVIADTIPLPVAALRADGQLRDAVEQVASDAEELAGAANLLAADLRRACGGEPTPWDKGQRPGAAIIKALDPVVRRVLAGLAQHPDSVEQALFAWHETARRIAWEIVEPLLADLPPAAFIGRTQGQGARAPRTYRAATAEQAFRRRLNQILHLTKPDNRTKEAS